MEIDYFESLRREIEQGFLITRTCRFFSLALPIFQTLNRGPLLLGYGFFFWGGGEYGNDSYIY